MGGFRHRSWVAVLPGKAHCCLAHLLQAALPAGPRQILAVGGRMQAECMSQVLCSEPWGKSNPEGRWRLEAMYAVRSVKRVCSRGLGRSGGCSQHWPQSFGQALETPESLVGPAGNCKQTGLGPSLAVAILPGRESSEKCCHPVQSWEEEPAGRLQLNLYRA